MDTTNPSHDPASGVRLYSDVRLHLYHLKLGGFNALAKHRNCAKFIASVKIDILDEVLYHD